MLHKTLALVALFTAVPTPNLIAQATEPTIPGYVTDLGLDSEYREWLHHSSTAYEGAMRGEAAWMSAFGDLLIDESRAGINWEIVDSMQMDNGLKKTKLALERKRLLDSYREYKRAIRRGRREAAKLLWDKKYVELAHTYQLDEFQINWVTGTIYWPTVASSTRYAQHRQTISVLLEQVICYQAGDNRFLRERVAKACESFRNELRLEAAEAHLSTRNEYRAVQRFLTGLQYTPYLPPETFPASHLAMK